MKDDVAHAEIRAARAYRQAAIAGNSTSGNVLIKYREQGMEAVFWITPEQWDEAGRQALAREPDKLDEELSSEEPLVRVLKGHLRVEELLGEFIREAFLVPSEVDHFNHYETKVTVALGLGLFTWMKGPLGKLGNIRNKLGHDRHFSFDAKAAHEFRTTFPPTVIGEINSRHAVVAEKLSIPEKTIEELDPEDQFSACIIELFRELTRLIEAVKIAKSGKQFLRGLKDTRMQPVSDRSDADLQKDLAHVKKMEGIVENDERETGVDFSFSRNLLMHGRKELEDEINKRGKRS